ncbi:glycosyltransferase [Polaribacter cellanae]|uniref:Glycosyltransferase n=1 Tax=Polaribacter cellanae TaxID=2818493 RepID=A0A975CQU5_9FLAO|nr:glycosyltransferase [Polaribacter cellanae]QTE23045.1 glycosyltransferase [Polaribacter cellanae]
MKKILFLVNAGKITSNENGGASVYYSHLELLFKAGFHVEMVVLEWENQQIYIEEDYKEVSKFVSEISNYKVISKKHNKGLNRIVEAITNPSKFEYNFINKENFDFLKNKIQNNNIDLVWCEWRWSAILATNSALKIPVIYAHHDWEYKLAKLRKRRNFLQKFHTFQKKRVEMDIVKKATACISGSITEKEEIEKIASKKALYLPTTYKEIILKENNLEKAPSIMHLGGMNTTANRLGLERFLDVCWEDLKRKIPNVKLKVIGSLKQATPTLLKKLEDPQITCFGFVKDLNKVMIPKDIHIVPWEYNTGTRTRIPVILNYEQVLVATKPSVSCYKEITQENSVLCSNLEEMTEEIVNLYSNKERLHLLSSKGKEIFLETFTADNQFQKLKTFIHNLV